MSKILITGGAGFIGSNLTDALIDQGHEVLVVDNLSTGKKENLNPRAKFFKLDIGDKKLAKIFAKEKPEIVFHYAAQIDVRKSVEDPVFDAQVNVLGSINVLECCKNFDVKKIIFASSGGAIYGEAETIPTPEDYSPQPLSPYGIGKLIVEHYLNYYYQFFNLPFIALRLSNVYGPRQYSKGEAGVVAIFIDRLLEGKQPVINGDGQQTRDYVYVSDVISANLLALEKNVIGAYNISTGVETDVNQIAQLIKKSLKTDIEFIYGPAKIGEQKRSCLDFQKAKKELGWQPETSLEEGIKKTVEWFKLAKSR